MANLVSSTLTGNLTVTANVSAANYTGNGAALTGIASFASGTKMVFYQASAPTGWTQDTAAALSNAAMSVVTGTGGGTGGSDSFYSTFATGRTADTSGAGVSVSGTVGAHTLSTPEIASHSHSVNIIQQHPNSGQPNIARGAGLNPGSAGTNPAGGGGSHSHPFSVSSSSLTGTISMPAMNVKYANVIIATKD